MPDSCQMAHRINHQNQNFSPNLDNEKTVNHCSFAIAKIPFLNSKRTTQAFKPRASRKFMAHGVTGRVVLYNINKGYGFIHCDHNDNDIFVHYSDIAKNNPK